jgi:hypothetical protein
MFGYFLHLKSYVIILSQNGWGYILGDFLTNASGHPGVSPLLPYCICSYENAPLNNRTNYFLYLYVCMYICMYVGRNKVSFMNDFCIVFGKFNEIQITFCQ